MAASFLRTIIRWHSTSLCEKIKTKKRDAGELNARRFATILSLYIANLLMDFKQEIN